MLKQDLRISKKKHRKMSQAYTASIKIQLLTRRKSELTRASFPAICQLLDLPNSDIVIDKIK